jgi:hypothetical protein
MLNFIKSKIKDTLQSGKRPQKFARFFTNTGLALDRIKGRGVNVSTILDVGASDGRWSADALRFGRRQDVTLLRRILLMRSICERQSMLVLVLVTPLLLLVRAWDL